MENDFLGNENSDILSTENLKEENNISDSVEEKMSNDISKENHVEDTKLKNAVLFYMLGSFIYQVISSIILLFFDPDLIKINDFAGVMTFIVLLPLIMLVIVPIIVFEITSMITSIISIFTANSAIKKGKMISERVAYFNYFFVILIAMLLFSGVDLIHGVLFVCLILIGIFLGVKLIHYVDQYNNAIQDDK